MTFALHCHSPTVPSYRAPCPRELPVAPGTDQAVPDQNLWAGEAEETGWQLALKGELDAQAEPGRQRTGRPWVWGKNLSIGPGLELGPIISRTSVHLVG